MAMVAAAAIIASMALPPSRSTAHPDSAARECGATTMPRVAQTLFSIALSLQLFPTMTVRRLFGPIAAERHAAPAPRMALRMIGEGQRAGGAFAMFDVGEVFAADKLRQRFADRQQQGVRRAPAAGRAQGRPAFLQLDTAERLVAFEQTIERRQFVERPEVE